MTLNTENQSYRVTSVWSSSLVNAFKRRRSMTSQTRNQFISNSLSPEVITKAAAKVPLNTKCLSQYTGEKTPGIYFPGTRKQSRTRVYKRRMPARMFFATITKKASDYQRRKMAALYMPRALQ